MDVVVGKGGLFVFVVAEGLNFDTYTSFSSVCFSKYDGFQAGFLNELFTCGILNISFQKVDKKTSYLRTQQLIRKRHFYLITATAAVQRNHLRGLCDNGISLKTQFSLLIKTAV